MRLIDLTMPLFEGMGMQNCYPQERSFVLERMAPDYNPNLISYTMFCEPGTRIVLPLLGGINPNVNLETVELTDIMFRDAVIVDIPKEAGQGLTAEEIENACSKADYRQGDALIIRTGWGTVERLEQLGDDYQWQSPNYPDAACEKLREIMTAKKSDIFGYDTASMSDYAHVKPGWEALGRPKNWPSPEAKEFLKKMAEERKKNPPPPEGRGPTRIYKAGITLLGGLVNVASISKERVKLIALPLKIRGEAMAPVRVVAIEE